MSTTSFVHAIYFGTPSHVRTGQYLFNNLPPGAQEALAGTLSDPFYDIMSLNEMYDWVNNHLILDDQLDIVIGVFVFENLIWEA